MKAADGFMQPSKNRDPILFNRATFVGAEQDYIAEAIRKNHISGDGEYTRRCHQMLEEMLGTRKALLTTSCTHALEMAALLLEIQPGDEVIVPSFTFVSTINAFVLRGAQPVFVDIRPDTLNLDETLLSEHLSSRTKAVVVVHYGGVGCSMDVIEPTCVDRGVALIEDNAHGLLGRYRDRFLGTFGSLATLSFHETKNFSCGEGGALLINDASLIERAEIIREKGTNRSRFFRGQVDKYTWVDIGSSYLPSDLLAAFLCAQLEAREYIQGRRRRIWETYDSALASWADVNGVTRPSIPPECEQPYHLYYLLMPSLEARQALIAHLKAEEILAVFHYLPLHLSEMGRKMGGRVGDCPVTESVSDRLLRLPFYNDLSELDQQRIIDTILRFVPRGA